MNHSQSPFSRFDVTTLCPQLTICQQSNNYCAEICPLLLHGWRITKEYSRGWKWNAKAYFFFFSLPTE